ncbi:MAG: hypothetical protein LBD09_01500, partial [Treponema sp.]|nr:hypothetical protein [Treponema sp.]
FMIPPQSIDTELSHGFPILASPFFMRPAVLLRSTTGTQRAAYPVTLNFFAKKSITVFRGTSEKRHVAANDLFVTPIMA